MADTAAEAPQTNGHPTPSPQTVTANSQSQSQSQSQPSAPAPTASLQPLPSQPGTSATDTGSAKRPRDARLIHMLLSSLGITAYQDRVPLLLLDFAYRHTSSILSDALHLSSDAYISQQNRAREPLPASHPNNPNNRDVDEKVTMSAVQLAIQSRLQYQFNGGAGGGLAKEFLMEVAENRNKVALPRAGGTEWGVRLPGEKFVLSGVGWGLRDEWEGDDGDEDEAGDGDVDMGGMLNAAPGAKDDEPVDGEGVEGGTVEDMFGDDLEDDAMEMEDP